MKKGRENKKKTGEANESNKARKQFKKKTVKSFIFEQTNTEKKSTRVKLKKIRGANRKKKKRCVRKEVANKIQKKKKRELGSPCCRFCT